MILDLFKSNVDKVAPVIEGGFLPTAPQPWATDFGTAFDSAVDPTEFGRDIDYRQSLYEDSLRALEKRTGERIANPMDLSGGFDPLGNPVAVDPDRAQLSISEVDAKLAEASKTYADVADPANFSKMMTEESRRRQLAMAKAEAGDASGSALFLGGAIGDLSHPISVMTAPLGASGLFAKGLLARILVTGLTGAAAGGGSQALSEAADYANMKQYGTRRSASEIIGNIQGAAMFGALFGAGASALGGVFGIGKSLIGKSGRTLIEGAQKLFRRSDDPLSSAIAKLREIKDALAAVESETFNADGSPTGAKPNPEHGPALQQAVEEVNEGKPVTAETKPDAAETTAASKPSPAKSSPHQGEEMIADVEAKTGTPKAPELPMPENPQLPRRATTAAGRSIDVDYAVVEADSLVTSHGDDMEPNAAFPQELQPRDRSRAAYGAQVAENAANLRPEWLAGSPKASDGAPIIGPDNLVESGNGRILSIRRAYAQHPERAAAYRAHIESLGFDTSGFKNPVLIRRRATGLSPAERIAFTREANASDVAARSASETAFGDAERIDGALLDLYQGGGLDLAKNAEFVRQLMRTIPEAERSALMDRNGVLNADGLKRMNSAMLAKAYGDPGLIETLTEATDSEIKAIGKALLDVAPKWARMRARAAAGQIAPSMDVTADLLAAVKLIENARKNGEKVGDILAQGDMFGGGLTTKGAAMLRLLFRDAELRRPAGQAALAERLGAYIDEAEKTQPGVDMFGESAPAPETIAATVGKTDGANPAIVAAGETVTQATETTPATQAAESDAIKTEAETMLDEADFDVPIDVIVEKNKTAARTMSAREFLRQTKEQIKVARQVAACGIAGAA